MTHESLAHCQIGFMLTLAWWTFVLSRLAFSLLTGGGQPLQIYLPGKISNGMHSKQYPSIMHARYADFDMLCCIMG